LVGCSAEAIVETGDDPNDVEEDCARVKKKARKVIFIEDESE
jgi:hypothetical protein